MATGKIIADVRVRHRGLAIASNRYTFLSVGLSGVVFQAIAARLVVVMPNWLSANRITGIGFIASCCVIPALLFLDSLAGVLIITALSLDFLDGAVARHRGTASKFGALLDATSDLALWLNIVIGLYITTESNLAVGILIVYTVDLFWRHILGHSAILLAGGSESYRRANVEPPILRKMKPFVYPFINYYDSVVVLALLLIAAPAWVSYWLVYELLRRLLLLIKKGREILYIYKTEDLGQ